MNKLLLHNGCLFRLVLEPDPDADQIMAPDIVDQSEFTQDLFDHWDVHARFGPATHGKSSCM